MVKRVLKVNGVIHKVHMDVSPIPLHPMANQISGDLSIIA